MRRAARILLGLLAAAGWLLLALALVLWVGEETGLVGRLVRDALAARLGALGDDLRLEGVRLRWFDGAIEIQRAELGQGGELALLRDVRVAFGRAQGAFEVDRVEVRGGHLHLSPALVNGLQTYSEKVGGEQALRRGPSRLPTIQVEGLELGARSRRWGLAPIGRLDLLARSNARGLPELFGRLVPSLTSRTGEPGQVFLSGTLDDAGRLVLRANATRLPLGTDGLPPDEALDGLRALAPRGSLELEGWAELPLDGGAPRGRVRLAVQHGGLVLKDGAHHLEGLQLDVEARWSPRHLEDWRDPRTWHALARASGTWNGAALEATALLGEEAGPEDLVAGWAHCAALPLERALLASLDAGPIAERVWDALEPQGTAEVWASARLPRLRAEGPAERGLEAFAVVRPGGAAALAYHGMVRNAAGELDEGFPLPLAGVTGEVGVAVSVDGARPYRIGLVDLAGVAGTTAIRARGTVQAHRRDVPPDAPGHGMAELDLDLATDDLPVDDALRGALLGLSGALPPDGTWRQFSPEGGRLDVHLRLCRTPRMAWLSTDLDLGLHGVSLAWSDLPIPFLNTEGRLRFRSDGNAQQALAIALEGRSRTSQRLGALVRLRSQGDPAPEQAEHERLGDLAHVRVEVERISLTGDDRRILVEHQPDIGPALDELAPKGFADGVYERVVWDRAADGEPRAEVTPLAPAQVVPRRFPLTVADVRGRVLLSERGEPDDLRIAPLVGVLGDGVQVALTAELPGGTLRVLGAGVDPASKSLLGAVGGLFTGPDASGPAFDSSALQLSGRLDVAGTIPLGGEGGTGAGRWRFFVRDSSLATPTGFRLDALRGELVFADAALSGAGLDARLSDTPVVLDDVRFGADADAWRLDVRFDAENVPVDRAHLAGFVGASTLDGLLDELGWHGRFDFKDGELALTVPSRGSTRLELAGAVVPRGMGIQLGLPLEVERADARVERLIWQDGKVRALVRVDDLEGRVAGRKLRDAALLVTYVEPTLSIESLEGRLEGGRIQALGAGAERAGTAFSITLADPFPFQLALDLRRVQVAGLLRGLFPSGVATRGDLDGELRLSGDLEHLLGITGSGSVRVRDSRLWSVPVFRALFGQIGLDDTATFDSMYTNLRIQDGRVDMSDMLLRSPLVQLVGEGSLDFDGALHHDLEVRYAIVDNLGPLTRLLYWIQNELLSVEIRGDMGRPVVVLQNPFRRLFSGREDYRRLPAPGYAPLPARF